MRVLAASSRLLLLILLLCSLPACGIEFGNDFEGTELFDGLKLEGSFTSGSPVTVTTEINDAYPVPVRIACYYENQDHLSDDQKSVAFQERATLFGEHVFDAVPDAQPDDDVENQTLSFSFTPQTPGSYFVACITPASPDNGIGKQVRVR